MGVKGFLIKETVVTHGYYIFIPSTSHKSKKEKKPVKPSTELTKALNILLKKE